MQAGEIPLDLAETGGSLADYLLKEADRRAQLDRKFQCSVTLGDGKVIGSSSKERLECWFTPLACQVMPLCL